MMARPQKEGGKKGVKGVKGGPAELVSSTVERSGDTCGRSRSSAVVDKKQPAKHSSTTLYLVGACIDHH